MMPVEEKQKLYLNVTTVDVPLIVTQRWRETKVVFKFCPYRCISSIYYVEEKQKLYLNKKYDVLLLQSSYVEEKQKLYLN